MLRARNLHVTIDGTTILHGVDFIAEPGEVTAIVGPNGSGKSTLLSALTGTQTFDGEAQMGALDLATAKPWELAARRAVLAQFTSVAFPFTVSEVVRIGGGEPDLTTAALARACNRARQGGVPHEVRRVLAEGGSRYLRPMPGAARRRTPSSIRSRSWLVKPSVTPSRRSIRQKNARVARRSSPYTSLMPPP